MHFVIAYDIPSDRRRQKIMNRLKDSGVRVQYSVFEAELDEARFQHLLSDLLKLLRPRDDRLHVYRLCQNCYLRSQSFGKSLPLEAFINRIVE
jgi:CRISPR-associated protein Cas2